MSVIYACMSIIRSGLAADHAVMARAERVEKGPNCFGRQAQSGRGSACRLARSPLRQGGCRSSDPSRYPTMSATPSRIGSTHGTPMRKAMARAHS